MIKVIIPEPITSLNKGEAAILEGIAEALNVYGECELTVYSPPEWIDDDRRNYEGRYNVVSGVDLFDVANSYREVSKPRSRIDFLKTWGKLLLFSVSHKIFGKRCYLVFKDQLLRRLSDTDLIVAAHDGFLGYRHFYLALAGRIMGIPLALYGGGNDAQGRSPWKIRKYYQFTVNKAIICVVRDIETKNYLLENDVEAARVHVFPDPAVLVKACSEQRLKQIFEVEGIPLKNPLFGLVPVQGGIVSEKSFTEEKDSKKRRERRIEVWVKILEHLMKHSDAHLLFLPHCIGPVPRNDDRLMARAIHQRARVDKRRVTMIESEYSASELKGIIKRCEFVLGERTHALIGAGSVGTPCMAMTVKEDRRMHSIINKMFKQRTYNLNNPDPEELKCLVLEQWKNRGSLTVKLSVQSNIVKSEALKAAMLLKKAIEKAFSKE